MIDDVTYLMVSIFQQLFPSDEDTWDIEAYVKDTKLSPTKTVCSAGNRRLPF
jgi:hypothetical protein